MKSLECHGKMSSSNWFNVSSHPQSDNSPKASQMPGGRSVGGGEDAHFDKFKESSASFLSRMHHWKTNCQSLLK